MRACVRACVRVCCLMWLLCATSAPGSACVPDQTDNDRLMNVDKLSPDQSNLRPSNKLLPRRLGTKSRPHHNSAVREPRMKIAPPPPPPPPPRLSHPSRRSLESLESSFFSAENARGSPPVAQPSRINELDHPGNMVLYSR